MKIPHIINFLNFEKVWEKRYQTICKLVDIKSDDKILDIGCHSGRDFEFFNDENEIIGIDINPDQKIHKNNFKFVCCDACDLGIFSNNEFDVVVSIGVFEHIFPYEKLIDAVNEVMRVGKSWVIIVPHKHTLIEPHYQLPLWQYYPDWLKSTLVKKVNLTWYGKNKDGNFVDIHYFDIEKWRSLFPGSSTISFNTILFGLSKSLIIYNKN